MAQEELKRKTYLDKAIDRRITQKAAAETLGFSERSGGFSGDTDKTVKRG